MFDKNKENGYVLVLSLVFLTVSSILITAMVMLARYGLSELSMDSDDDSALLLAMSGMEKTKQNIASSFRNYLYALPDSGAAHKIDWFDTFNQPSQDGRVGKGGYNVDLPLDSAFTHSLDSNVEENVDKDIRWRKEGRYSVSLSSTIPVDSRTNRKDPSLRYVKVKVSGTVGNSTRTIEEVIKYGIESVIAQYAYFQNQPMYVKPTSRMKFNGDLRSNGNMKFVNNNGKIAGDVYASIAAEFGSLGIGSITGDVSAVPVNEYNNNASTDLQARPLYDEGYWYGYKPLDAVGDAVAPQVRTFENEPQINVPPLGNLDDYKEDGAWIKKAGKILVNKVHSSNHAGIDGVSGSPDDGSIYLVGTESNPINISGSVVIEGDVVIKGYITGKGSIYASKNIHVIGDVKYKNPPQWNKPTSSVDNQLDKDLVGFMAKGNIIFGNSEKIGNREPLLKAPYPHKAPLSDASNGFDSDNNKDNGVEFDGDYSKVAKAFDEDLNRVVNLKRINIPYRAEKKLTNPFHVPAVTKKIYENQWNPDRKVWRNVWNGQWRTKSVRRKVWTGRWIDDPNGAIGSAEVPKIKEMVWKTLTEKEKVYERKQFSEPGYEKVLVETKREEDRYWIDTKRADLDCGRDTSTRVREIRPGDKVEVNGDVYTVKTGHSGGIRLTKPVKNTSGGVTKINSVKLLERNYTVKNKRYYEPAVEGRFIKREAERNPSHFDGVYFTNHLIAGKLNNITVNGSIITRDSALKIRNRAVFNWDMRLAVSHGSSNMATIIGLPKNHSNTSVYWREL